ncbi:MAG TPA: 4Fe-4S binding protein, partial [Candidatus Omnitrophota bacterium]|nr:4Fe-4S binding protein [Candidatus Omnitrophota bacterium]
NPVLSTLQYFEEEYRTHIKDKRCPAGKCSQLFNYSIIQEKCRRCTLCQRNCPVGAIPGDREQGFWIVPEKCIRCGQCFEVCKFGAIKR